MARRSESRQNALSLLRRLLGAGNIRTALKLLNQSGPHRYSAIFAFDTNLLRNAWFYDRQHPELSRIEDAMPVTDSYCVFVRDTAESFTILDSLGDQRIGEHPKRQVFRSYCGVPVLNDDGTLWGTICHFDPDPHEVSDQQLELLEAAAWQLKQIDREDLV